MGIIFTGRLPEIVKRTATAVNYTTQGESIIAVTNTAITRTITLADADKFDAKRIEIKDESGGASLTTPIIVQPETGTIDGVSSVQIIANYGILRLYSDGVSWFSR